MTFKGQQFSSIRDACALTLRGLRKLMRPMMDFGSIIFFERDLLEPLPEALVNPDITLREAFLADLDLLDVMDSPEHYKRIAVERLQRGDRWFIAIDSATGELANFRWMSHAGAWIPEIKRYLQLRPGEVYFYDLYTRPHYRRMGIDAMVRHKLYTSLLNSGMIKVYAYVQGGNYPMLQVSRRMLRRVGRIWYLRFGEKQPLIACSGASDLPELLTTPLEQPKLSKARSAGIHR